MSKNEGYEDLTEGKFVYWMNADKHVDRNQLGKIVEVCDDYDDGKLTVKFSTGKFEIDPRWLCASDIQVGAFVQVAGDSDEAIGEVKGMDEDDDTVIVEVKGENQKHKPKKLILCDVQPESLVFWTKADDDIPGGHLGVASHDLNDKGRVRVKFPNGTWRFKPSEMVRAHIQPLSYVQWTSHDEDIPIGEVGQVVGDMNDEGKVKVHFAKGTWRFKPEDLFLCEIQLGAFVKTELRSGEVGQVVGLKVEESGLRVHFMNGTFTLTMKDLELYRIQPGNYVHWKKHDSDIPEGSIGQAVRMRRGENRMSIIWPKGGWTIKPKQLSLCPVQKGQRVQWVKSNEDIAEGDIGQVMSIRYKDDDEDNGMEVYVNFRKDYFSFSPSSLKPLRLGADVINSVKATFKKFDKNGDGKLTEEELLAVLGKIGGDGGLSEDDCKTLFGSLDKDGNGKLTTDEFIQYVFGSSASTMKRMLADGFGLESVLGFKNDDGEQDDDDSENKPSSGQAVDGPTKPVTAESIEEIEGIGPETIVSRAEWATAMLSVGVCRQAALEGFDGCLADLKQEEDPALKYLAAELGGMGGTAGVEELRAAVGKVKHGTLELVDLSVPSAEVEAEIELAKKTGCDGLLFHLNKQDKPFSEAWSELTSKSAKLSAIEYEAMTKIGEENMEAVMKATSENPPMVSAMASLQRAREHCRREVQAIIFVDREKPCINGWNPRHASSALPKKWERATDFLDDPKLTIDGQNANDVDQGDVGDCYLLGGTAAIVRRRRSFVRTVFPAYDIQVGVYGVLFSMEGHYTYEIVDDYLPVNNSSKRVWAKSTSPQELWVSILEKAYFKLYKCVETCYGGHTPDAVHSFLSGVHGKYLLCPAYHKEPSVYFEKLKVAYEAGEVLTTDFWKPSKGKYADSWLGLIGNHSYSILEVKEAHGHQMLCIRNPHAQGEWKGPWSDKSEEWTDELREAFGVANKDEGVFWMAIEDFLEFVDDVYFNRTFGPAWKTASVYGHADKEIPRARAKRDYQARERHELSYKKGDEIESEEARNRWMSGKHLQSGQVGKFQRKKVEYQCKVVYKFVFSVQDVEENSPIILALMREDHKQWREYEKKTYNGKEINEAIQECPTCFFYALSRAGKTLHSREETKRLSWTPLEVRDCPCTLWLTCPGGRGQTWTLRGFVPHGSCSIVKHDCTYSDFLDACSHIF
ncbi:DEK1 [Symbiodinium natans]|uniref:DEK1 protein n=1 Tax=Symbiodinium natans TaxID=878477 RepID=A0A812K449_9DINO|nr:DEK1 [Symbiodinium natans]